MNKNVSFRIIGKLIKFMPAFACACLCLFATAAFAQDNTLTVRLDKVPLTQAISKIEGESRYLFMLGDGIDAARQIVSVDAESQPINQVLDQLVRGTGLTYSVEGQNILLSVKKDDSRPVRISGKVLDGNGFPVIGAAVLVKGTTIGVSTDLNGDYTLQVPPPPLEMQSGQSIIWAIRRSRLSWEAVRRWTSRSAKRRSRSRRSS